MTHIQEMAAMAALNHMFKEGYFSICAIDKVAKMLNVNPKGKTYDVLSTLHCVSYDQMPKELREAIPDMIRECLSLNPMYEFAHLKKQTVIVEQNPVKRFLSYVNG